MSDYNPKETDQQPEESNGKCKASGCPLAGSLNVMSQGWFCVYHSTQDKSVWSDITQMLVKTKRVHRIIKVVESTNCDDFKNTREWKLSEGLKPLLGECHPKWVYRVKDTIHQELKKRVVEIMKKPQPTFEGMTNKTQKSNWAINELTSGALLNRK